MTLVNLPSGDSQLTHFQGFVCPKSEGLISIIQVILGPAKKGRGSFVSESGDSLAAVSWHQRSRREQRSEKRSGLTRSRIL